MTEALIAIPTFIAIFAIAVYLLRSHMQRQNLREETRGRVWAQVVPGCGPGDPDLELLDLLEDDNFDGRARSNVNRYAAFIDTFRASFRSDSKSASVTKEGVLGGGTDTFSSSFIAGCNETERNTEGLMWAALRETLCRQGACGASTCECAAGASECINDELQRACVMVDGCGVWDIPRKCADDHACFNGQCEACDPDTTDGLLTELPPCPGANTGGGGE